MAQSLSRLLLVQLTIALFAITTSAQKVVPNREQPLRVVDYSGDMLTLISHLPSTFDTPFAFEIDPFEQRSSLTFRVTDATLDDVMNAIVKAKPNYAWRRNGGTIELYPAERTHPLLDTRISSLRINNLKVSEALQQLLSAVEVKQALLNYGLRLVPTVSRDDYRDISFSISADNITLRQALNQIAESSGTRFWAFELIGPNRGAVWI